MTYPDHDTWLARREVEREIDNYRFQSDSYLAQTATLIALLAKLAAMPKVYRVPEPNLMELEARFEKMAKQAAKIEAKTGIKVEAPRIVKGESETVKVKRDGREEPRTYIYLTVEGGQVKVPGWQFLATLEHKEHGNIIRRVPGLENMREIEALRNAAPDCEHCHAIRNRIDTYVVLREADNTVMQVGSTCLRDFTGGLSPAQCASWAEMLFSALDDLEGEPDDEVWTSRVARRYHREDLLLQAAALIRVEGYQSAKDEYGDWRPGTARWTRDALSRTGRFAPARNAWETEVPPEVIEEDHAAVASATEWAVNNPDDSEFTNNMRVLVQNEWLEDRDAGIVCYVPEGYRRHVADAARKAAGAKSVHLGSIKEKLTLSVTVTRANNGVETNYGTAYWQNFVTDDGAIVEWKSSRSQEFKDGDKLLLTGTVKAHREFRGVKSTSLTRCKFQEV